MKEKIKKHKKKLIIIGCILIIIIIIASVRSNMEKRRNEMMQAMNQTETATVEKRTLMSSVSATGSITSAESKDIAVSLNNVEVESVNVEIGDMVNAGDILCTFNSEDIEESLAEAKASLNVTTTKTQMNITSSERSLAEAVESSDIDQARSNADVADALTAYEEALDEIEDAEDAYDDAEDDADDYKEELNSLNSQKSSLETEMNTYISNFGNAKAKIIELVEGSNSVELKDGFNEISIEDSFDTNDIYEEKTASISENNDTGDSGENSDAGDAETTDDESAAVPIDENGDSEDDNSVDITGSIDSQLTIMKTAQSSYNNCVQSIAGLNTQIEFAQKKYETAKQTENSMESAYEQAVSAADSKYDAYEQQLRSQEDKARSNESTIANRTDSVTTSKLDATTSGTNDKNQIEQYEEQLEDCTVISPISGVITAFNIEAGDNYSGSAIATIEDISSYKITTEIDEYDIVDIEEGQKVVIKTNGTGDLELDGTVESIAPRATAQTGNSSDVTYTVTISVDTPCDDLKLDMTAKLSIILESKENVLTVPYNAVQEDEEGNFYVEAVSGDALAQTSEAKGQDEAGWGNEAHMQGSTNGAMSQRPGENGRGENAPQENTLPTTRIYITKGIESDYYIEVISDEITEGMQVVVPKTEDTQSIMNMMMRQGPMGGF